MRCACVAAILALAGLLPVQAAVLRQNIIRGDPVSQTFISQETSIIGTETAVFCAASGTIHIASSSYTASNGDNVDFAEFVRSPAANMTFLADAVSKKELIRVEFKYTLAQPPVMEFTDGKTVILADFIELAGDSILIDNASLAATIRSNNAVGAEMVVSAKSRDTGREVVDTVPRIPTLAYRACIVAADGLPDHVLPSPDGAVSISYNASPDHERRSSSPATWVCQASGETLDVYEGDVRSATGFVLPTSRLLASFDSDGQQKHLPVPRLFDAKRRLENTWRVDISVAADVKNPATINRLDCPHRVFRLDCQCMTGLRSTGTMACGAGGR